jgi:hypothetical protein
MLRISYCTTVLIVATGSRTLFRVSRIISKIVYDSTVSPLLIIVSVQGKTYGRGCTGILTTDYSAHHQPPLQCTIFKV